MKARIIRNWITTIFGALLMFAAITMLVVNRLPEANLDFSWIEFVGTALLGWVFLMAKNSLIEGLFLGIFKVPSKD